jgi:hypothetical protein
MARFLAVAAVLLAACAHQHTYSIGDDYSIEENERGIYLWNERPSVIYGMQKGPVFMIRPSKDNAANHCYEGFFNPREIMFLDSRASTAMMPFALCPDPDLPQEKAAFRLDLHVTGREGSGMQYFPFTVRLAESGTTEVGLEGAEVKRVKLAADVGPFRDHPEIIGAIVAVGALPDGSPILRR